MMEPMSKNMHEEYVTQIRDAILAKTGLELHLDPEVDLWYLCPPGRHIPVVVAPVTGEGVVSDIDRLRAVWMWLASREYRDA